MAAIFLGIDISKAKLDIALHANGKYKYKRVANSTSGFKELCAWLVKHKIGKVHACMEATGSLWEDVATYLHDEGHVVSVVNPVVIKRFGESALARTKNDKVDSKLIVDFCDKMVPEAWHPAPMELRTLQALCRRRDALVSMKTQEENRKANNSMVDASIEIVINHINQEIERITKLITNHIDQNPNLKQQVDLLTSIPGIGTTTAAIVIAELRGFEHFEKIGQVVAFAGLSPKERTSGSSVRGKATICKVGNSRLRKALYMPAIVARRYNPLVMAFANRLEAQSKSKKTIICACMKKLLHIMFGVIKHGKKFDREILNRSLALSNCA